MSSPLITTKFHIPQLRSNPVLRQRLTQKLNEGLHRKLSLLSASAGYGKTTLASEWLAICDRSAAWLSLDEGDNDLYRFLTYLIASFHRIADNRVNHALTLLQSPQSLPVESILAALINDLAKLDPFLLVLDDYHVIHNNSVNEAIAFLLEHSPPNMHMVILTREEPNLPLARFRVRDEVTDLSIADLRFNTHETTAFLNQTMNVELSLEELAVLENRTEGWIAGLQIAAVSLKEHPAADRLIQPFMGNHRLLFDYLIEEVLIKLPESIQKFLLYTSILDRFSGPLCDALLLHESSIPGEQILLSLERANLFLVPMDSEQRWYRYHQLFAELLRQRLEYRLASSSSLDGPENVAELHLRASVWYEDNGLPMEAFRHAVAAGHMEQAARLVEGEGMPLHLRGEAAPVLSWLEMLSKAELDARPSLWVMYASVLLMVGRPAGIEPKLQAAEAAMQGSEADAAHRNLIGLIAATRAAVAAMAITGQSSSAYQRLLAVEDALQMTAAEDKTNELVEQITRTHAAPALESEQLNRIIALANRAIDHLNSDLLPVRITALWLLGVAYQLRGDRVEASKAYLEVLSIGREIGSNVIGIMTSVGLGNLFESDNRLYEAEERYRSVLQLSGDLPLPAVCDANMGLARICYEWNDLENAKRYAQQSVQVAREINSKNELLTGEIFFARLKLAERDWTAAAFILREANAFARANSLLHRLPEMADVQMILMLHRGDTAGALHLAETHRLPLTLSRAHLAFGNPAEAMAVLEPYRALAETKRWKDEQLKAMVLQAAIWHVRGEKDQVVQILIEALELAEPGGFIRLFIGEGLPIIPLLSEAAVRGRFPDYTEQLLAAYEREKKRRTPDSAFRLESLTQRELEILQLIAQGLSNREIGERLYLALDTVKGHNRRLFEKLQVQRRTEAIALARKLGLLE